MEPLTKILEMFHDAKVEFSLIGGMASRQYGVTLLTDDIDVCARFSPENLRRIEAALKDAHPVHRLTANRLPFELTDELCTRLKNVYLKTDLGIVDCLSNVAGVGDFDAVLKQSELMQYPFGRCFVLKIEALIDAKNAVGRPHDLAAVKQLKAIKEKTHEQRDLF